MTFSLPSPQGFDLTETLAGRWSGLAGTVGAEKPRPQGVTNQDHFRLDVDESSGAVRAVVADGHGARRHFRSDQGARLACLSFLHQAHEFLQATGRVGSRKRLAWNACAAAADRLPVQIYDRWLGVVDGHRAANPFLREELSPLSPTDQEIIDRYPRDAYGTTLLGVIICDDFLLALQIGDGDIVVADDHGVRSLVPPLGSGPRNQTPSLCDDEAQNQFRLRLLPFSDDTPPLVLLGSDGYRDCFHGNSDAFYRSVGHYLRIIRGQSLRYARTQFRHWLCEAAPQSGDDLTTILLVNTDQLLEQSLAAAMPDGAVTIT